jgi:hypothetical protein
VQLIENGVFVPEGIRGASGFLHDGLSSLFSSSLRRCLGGLGGCSVHIPKAIEAGTTHDGGECL